LRVFQKKIWGKNLQNLVQFWTTSDFDRKCSGTFKNCLKIQQVVSYHPFDVVQRILGELWSSKKSTVVSFIPTHINTACVCYKASPRDIATSTASTPNCARTARGGHSWLCPTFLLLHILIKRPIKAFITAVVCAVYSCCIVVLCAIGCFPS